MTYTSTFGTGAQIDAALVKADMAVISQAEAEAGTATDRRAWTAQRVAQAIGAQTGDTLADWRDMGSETLIAATSGLQAGKIAYADLFVLARDFETNENDARIVDKFGGGTYTPRADQTVLWRGYSIKPVNMDEDDIWLGAPEFIVVAVSDETTALTTGTAKRTFRMPGAFTLVDVRASVATAPTGSALTVDINEAGVTVLSTKLTIDAGDKTSVGATAPPVISDSAIAADAEITIDIDTVGSSVAGAGLKVTLIGYFV